MGSIFVDRNLLYEDRIYYRSKQFSNSALYTCEKVDYLVYLITESKLKTPFSISSTGNFEFSESIRIKEGKLILDTHFIPEKEIVYFDSRFSPTALGEFNADNFNKFLNVFCMFSHTGIPYYRYFDVEPVFKSDRPAEIVDFLKGFGKGLTPAGDDFILGYDLMALLLEKNPESLARHDINIYSRNLQSLFSELFLPEFLHFLLSDIFCCDKVASKRVIEVVRMVSKFGNSTGYSICDGVLFYLSLRFLK